MYKIVKWYTICLIGRIGVATESFGLRHALDADHIAAIASERLKQWQEVGEIISTCVSACFLFAIALINLLAMQDTYRALFILNLRVHMHLGDVRNFQLQTTL